MFQKIITLNKYKIILQITAVFAVFFSVNGFAIADITKNIILPYDTPHVFMFDEEIVDYKFEKEKTFKTEFPASIFDNKKKLLIIPVKNIDNKLIVQTKSEVYNFNIKFIETKKIIIKKSNAGGWLSNFLLSMQHRKITEEYELDSPPLLSENECGTTSFNLDNPPKMPKAQ